MLPKSSFTEVSWFLGFSITAHWLVVCYVSIVYLEQSVQLVAERDVFRAGLFGLNELHAAWAWGSSAKPWSLTADFGLSAMLNWEPQLLANSRRKQLQCLIQIQSQKTLPKDMQVTQDLQYGVHVARVAKIP